jgi:hypothetical protein
MENRPRSSEYIPSSTVEFIATPLEDGVELDLHKSTLPTREEVRAETLAAFELATPERQVFSRHERIGQYSRNLALVRRQTAGGEAPLTRDSRIERR